jgi:hypothetical protein
MSTRPIKPKEYFAKFLATLEDEIDYSEIPPTTVADWDDAEVLFPVTVEEFRAIKTFINRRRRRQNGKEAAQPQPA